MAVVDQSGDRMRKKIQIDLHRDTMLQYYLKTAAIIIIGFCCVSSANISIKPIPVVRVQAGARIEISPELINEQSLPVDFSCLYDGNSQLPWGATFNSDTGVFKYDTEPASAGTHSLEITATSSELSTTSEVSIIIEPTPQASSNTILFEDDFSDNDYTAIDPDHQNGLSWQVVSGTVANGSINNRPSMKLNQDSSRVVTNQSIQFLNYTIVFDCTVTYSAPVGLLLLYQDSDNYYRLNITHGLLSITRYMDGTAQLIDQAPTHDFTLPHNPNVWGRYKVNVVYDNSQILFRVGRYGTGSDYDLVFADSSSTAFNQFSEGRVGFYDDTTGWPDSYRFNVLSVQIFSDCLKNERTPVTFFVSPTGSDLSNSGTNVSEPWQTIDQAAKSAMAGDTILVDPGVYRESISFGNSGSSLEPITLKATQSLGSVTIEGSTLIPNGWNGPDAHGIYSISYSDSNADNAPLQGNKKLAIAMQPDAIDANDTFKRDLWYTVTDDVVVASDSAEETAMVNAGVEYLTLSEDFRTANGQVVADDFWNGAILYHYNRNLNVTYQRPIIDYDAATNRITVALIQDDNYHRIIPPNDKYALANHRGLISQPGEYCYVNGELLLRPYGDVLSEIGLPSLVNGITISKSHIKVVDITVSHFKQHGVYIRTSEGVSLDNLLVQNNGKDGINGGNCEQVTIDNCEITLNWDNGVNFGSSTRQIDILDSYIHHNGNNGIWLGSGAPGLYACEDVLIKNTRIMFQGTTRSHPDNIQPHQVNNLVIEDCWIQQARHQNMWCTYNGKFIIRNNVFIGGTLGFNGVRELDFYNNLIRNAQIRMDGYQDDVSVAYTSSVLIGKSDFLADGWNNIVADIQGNISEFPQNLIWDGASAIVSQIRALPEGENISEDLKDQVVTHINNVIQDLDFIKKNPSILNQLESPGSASAILNAMVARGVIDLQGNKGSQYIDDLEHQIIGLNRVILDELVLDNRTSKSVHNYRNHDINMKNNAFIECYISAPRAHLKLNEYFEFSHNYYNIENSFYHLTWESFRGFGTGSIISRTPLDLANQFAGHDQDNYELTTSSHLIDAGTDVGLSYNQGGPDIGAFESDSGSTQNHTPVFDTLDDVSTSEGTPVQFAVSATDADGDTISYSATNLPTGATFSGNQFHWIPASGQAGTYSVNFYAADQSSQTSTQLTITVQATSTANAAPVLASIENKQTSVNTLLNFTISATDADGDTLSYSAQSLPTGASLSGQTFAWTPSANQIGNHTITFGVSDGTDTDSTSVSITVIPSDVTAPTVVSIAPQADAIQVPLNSLVAVTLADAGDGIDPATVRIQVDDTTVYTGDTANYDSATGECRRSGTASRYHYNYQPDVLFNFDQQVTVTVNASDTAGNAMTAQSYTFRTEMYSFGENVFVAACSAPTTVTDGNGTVWAAWHSGNEGARDIYIGQLNPATGGVVRTAQLTTQAADQCYPTLAVDSTNRLYLAWQDNRHGNWNICVSTSTDGTTWTPEVRITDIDAAQTAPAIAVDGQGTAYIVWQDARNGHSDIYGASSSSLFVNQTEETVCLAGAEQTEPVIAIDSNNSVFVFWTDTRNGNQDLYGASSTNSWTQVAVVAGNANQNSPSVGVDPSGTALYLAWVDYSPGNPDVYYASMTGLPDSPVSGTSVIDGDENTGATQEEPSIVTGYNSHSSLRIYVCWTDHRSVQESTDTDLYFADLSHGSAGTNIFVGDNSTNSNQIEPALGIDQQGEPYVIWTDDRSGQPELYYCGSTYTVPQALGSGQVSAAEGGQLGPDTAAIDSVDDISVVVPAGAVPVDLTVSISEIRNPPGFDNSYVTGYEFGPSGVEFTQPVTVTIPYNVAELGANAMPYWYNSVADSLSQNGITDVQRIVISDNLHALQFKTTHFTPYYVIDGGSSSTPGAAAGGGGCALAPFGAMSPWDICLPYLGLAFILAVTYRRDRRRPVS